MKSLEYYNSLYLLERKEKESEILRHCSLDIESIDRNPDYRLGRWSWLKDYLELKLAKPLYFSFGKYKGRIVQDIMEKDKGYCYWFVRNVISDNQETLRILDFISKNGKRYTVSNPLQELKNIFKNDLKIELKEDGDKRPARVFSELYHEYGSIGYSEYSDKAEFDF